MRSLKSLLVTSFLVLHLQRADAVELEPLGKAVGAVLGTTKAFKKSIGGPGGAKDVFYAKDAKGKASKVAFVEKGLYPPNCTHTWVIGLDVATGKVTEVRATEMACPHAFPTKTASFLSQYQGKGVTDVATLDSKIDTVAKATGSAKLTTEAVKRSIMALNQSKGQL